MPRLSLAWGVQATSPPSRTSNTHSARHHAKAGILHRPSCQITIAGAPTPALCPTHCPPGASRRVVERYSLEDTNQPSSSKVSNRYEALGRGFHARDGFSVLAARKAQPRRRGGLQQTAAPLPMSLPTSALRRACLARCKCGSSEPHPHFHPLCLCLLRLPTTRLLHLNIVPSRSSPPTSRRQTRPCKTYTPIIPPQEEVCVECAMRDQDMADVDVTSAGVWERASDRRI